MIFFVIFLFMTNAVFLFLWNIEREKRERYEDLFNSYQDMWNTNITKTIPNLRKERDSFRKKAEKYDELYKKVASLSEEYK